MNETTTTVTDGARCSENGSHRLSSRHTRDECPAETQEVLYDRAISHIKRLVDSMNQEVGYNLSEVSSGYSTDGLTFGYIGNLAVNSSQGGKGDDRSFCVFLPHPGRPGRYEDRFGGFAYGDLAGARGTVSQLAGALRLVRWQKSN